MSTRSADKAPSVVTATCSPGRPRSRPSTTGVSGGRCASRISRAPPQLGRAAARHGVVERHHEIPLPPPRPAAFRSPARVSAGRRGRSCRNRGPSGRPDPSRRGLEARCSPGSGGGPRPGASPPALPCPGVRRPASPWRRCRGPRTTPAPSCPPASSQVERQARPVLLRSQRQHVADLAFRRGAQQVEIYRGRSRPGRVARAHRRLGLRRSATAASPGPVVPPHDGEACGARGRRARGSVGAGARAMAQVGAARLALRHRQDAPPVGRARTRPPPPRRGSPSSRNTASDGVARRGRLRPPAGPFVEHPQRHAQRPARAISAGSSSLRSSEKDARRPRPPQGRSIETSRDQRLDLLCRQPRSQPIA